ncbi:hypothetical protein PG997_013233 [Apiospora hydei]|uniref:Uncharacterized protein n=1 Tax=Apiospora hydei TaxID=1337664 RepID=A0ABR1V854_9PEZI
MIVPARVHHGHLILHPKPLKARGAYQVPRRMGTGVSIAIQIQIDIRDRAAHFLQLRQAKQEIHVVLGEFIISQPQQYILRPQVPMAHAVLVQKPHALCDLSQQVAVRLGCVQLAEDRGA